MGTVGEGESETNCETRFDMCKKNSYWEPAIKHRELCLALCDDLEGWDEGWGRGWEGSPGGKGCMCTYG